ncbi:RNA-directed DNA polymerase, eukaryota [Tanacetum coccineum]|uniref:RNA-directed DNA polymerase, eukaryota n=1 Tax=Tanacetum coccineum TaxID=301880 RepID=A0ABQ5G7D2_9ASTR
MESIRSRFFNGIYVNEKKSSWFSWNKVLAFKDKCGLGVSSFYAMNRALIGGVEFDQFCALSIVLNGLQLPNMKDRWFWSLSGTSEFTAASARQFIDDHLLPEVSSKFSWRKIVPIKVNILAWKIKLNFLPSRLNLSRRGLDIPIIMCPICENSSSNVPSCMRNGKLGFRALTFLPNEDGEHAYEEDEPTTSKKPRIEEEGTSKVFQRGCSSKGLMKCTLPSRLGFYVVDMFDPEKMKRMEKAA